MQAAEVSRQDLFKACESLFGTDIDVSVEFLRYLKPAGVKAAYRKKALETHPDRAAVMDGKADFMEDRFKEIGLAYQLLREFLAAPWNYSLNERGTLYERKYSPRIRRRPARHPIGQRLIKRQSRSIQEGCRREDFCLASISIMTDTSRFRS